MDKIFTEDSKWIDNKNAIDKFYPKQVVYFMAHLAYYILPVFENKYPRDKQPRRAIEAALTFDKKKAKAAKNKVYASAHKPQESRISAASTVAYVVFSTCHISILAVDLNYNDKTWPADIASPATYAINDAAHWVIKSWDWINDLYNSMYQPVPLQDQYKTPDTINIAKRISEISDFTLMPILADALEDANYPPNDLIILRNRPDLHNLGNYFLWNLNNG